MCGIYGARKRKAVRHHFKGFNTLRHRGPDSSRFENGSKQVVLGFHRLRVNGLSASGDQPMHLRQVSLVCNGEIYNHQALAAKEKLECVSGSDCEVILRLYLKLRASNANPVEAFQATIESLDGVFALLLWDAEHDLLFAARDLIGIRPLFMSADGDAFASEAKALLAAGYSDVRQFPPGYLGVVEKTGLIKLSHHHHGGPQSLQVPKPFDTDVKDVRARLRNLFHEAVRKRLMSDRPVGCLLSGGVDSSLVAAVLSRELTRLGRPVTDLRTYSVGMPGSVDLLFAQKVADFLGSDHHTIELSEADFLAAVPATVYHTESFDTTTVRASVGNLLVSQYIARETEDRVIFVGDVADEVFGSYRGFARAPSRQAFAEANTDMLQQIHFYDVLRSDRTISAVGLEARVPFADEAFVKFCMALDPGLHKMFGDDDGRMEKHLLREAFRGYLPDSVLWRRKEAFSDGVSAHERSWFQVIREHVAALKPFATGAAKVKPHLRAPDAETAWYQRLFFGFFPSFHNPIPHYWVHPFGEPGEDPSARLLDCY